MPDYLRMPARSCAGLIHHVPGQMVWLWEESEKTVTFGMTALKVTERYNGRLKSRAANTKRVRSTGKGAEADLRACQVSAPPRPRVYMHTTILEYGSAILLYFTICTLGLIFARLNLECAGAIQFRRDFRPLPVS
jgi:hypothetical protein